MAIRDRRERALPLPADIGGRLARVAELCSRHGVRLAYLFGSLAREDRVVSPGDVDLAVLGGAKTDLWALRLELGEALGTDRLDLVDLGRASEVTRFEVLRTGKLLYKIDDDTENRFELRTIAEYKDRAVPRRIRARWLEESLGR
jgi:predicted nucleotidyltransferase